MQHTWHLQLTSHKTILLSRPLLVMATLPFIQVMEFYAVIPYQCFGGPDYLHLQQDLPKRWYPPISLHGVTDRKS